MARFNAAVMDGAADAKFQNRYNYLLDLLDMGYIVEKRIDGVPVRLAVSPEEGFAFYQGGGPTGWVYRGGLELIGDNLFLTSNAIKGVELSDRYLLWEDPPGVVGDPSLQLYDNDIRVGHLSFSDTMVRLSSIPISSGDSSSMVLVAAQYDANPQNYASFELYGNKLANNYANISVYSNPLSGGDYAQYIFSPTGIVAKLNGTDRTVWHAGNDGSGSTLDSDLLDGQEGTYYLHKKSTSASSGAAGATGWIKVATITFTARYNYAATRIEIIGSPSTAGVPYGCSLYFNAIQQNAFASNPLGVLHLSNASTITTAHIGAVIVTASATESVVEIYVQAIHAYKVLTTFTLEEIGSATISHTLGAWQASLPAGTAMTKAQID